MAVKYANFASGTISNNPLGANSTSIGSTAFAQLPVIATGDSMWLVLDPDGIGGAPEIVKVTGHISGSTSVAVQRGQQGTTARQHSQGTVWRCAVTRADLDSLDQSPRGALAYAQQTSDQTFASAGIHDIPGCEVTFTAVGGRRYRVTFNLGSLEYAGPEPVYALVLGGSAVVASRTADNLPGMHVTNTSFSPLTEQRTWRLAIQTPAAVTLDLSTTNPAWILVEDIGAL